MAAYLEKIIVRLPATAAGFAAGLASLLAPLGREENGLLKLTGSSPALYPEVCLDLHTDHPGVRADFFLSDGECLSVPLENSTGQTWASPYAYTPLPVDTVRRRLAASEISLIAIDHAGLNLPWFAPGLHPAIRRLRDRLAPCCLYHTYPTGEPWDFILPGGIDEIARRAPPDYGRVRRPKFEIVSFANTSTPLIQLDVGVNVAYETFAPLFPEALDEPAFRSAWVYLATPYPVDLCLVLNELDERDWSGYFRGFRLAG